MKTITWMTLGTLLETLSVPTAWAQGQVVEYYHLDALGTVRAVTEGSGTVLERHDYLPFGEELCPSGGTYVVCGTAPVGQSKRFTGKERDTETGLDYFGARYYGAKTGRFTTIDPVFTWQENLEDPQRWNRYAYGRNNPLKYADPDGRVLVPALLVAWGAVEIGLQIYDSYSTIQTLSDPNASFRDKAISGGGFVLGAIAPGGGYGAAGKAVAGKVDDAAKWRKTTTEMAHELSEKTGKNSVSFETSSVRGHIDLQGKAHFDKATGQRIPTPHVQTRTKHIGPNGEVNLGPQTTRPATNADVRTAEKLSKRKPE
ncbi:MAG TPA: RHS repeat-associated core domain-containing protein [Vicinamibacteria bacterium]|nr:RHS repeat-associated core domain-containing protein [Vicinamibacteria bacterium]HRB11606.1 RHS repeat-associated core domain-containing protein [Vicinamibacteria bacterium]